MPVEPLSVPETLEVARARHPAIPSPAVKRLLDTMLAAQGHSATTGASGGFGFASRSTGGRDPGVRDFFKLCSRVDRLGMFDGEDCVGVGTGLGDEEEDGGWFCSEAQALPVVVESLDVFAGHLTSKVMDFFFLVFIFLGQRGCCHCVLPYADVG